MPIDEIDQLAGGLVRRVRGLKDVIRAAPPEIRIKGCVAVGQARLGMERESMTQTNLATAELQLYNVHASA